MPEQNAIEPAQLKFDVVCSANRLALREIAENVRKLMTHPACSSGAPGIDVGEMKANVMLAYRCIEDATMRLGKAIQAYEGGKSIYDKTDKGRVK